MGENPLVNKLGRAQVGITLLVLRITVDKTSSPLGMTICPF